jgi:hypothetical protein
MNRHRFHRPPPPLPTPSPAAFVLCPVACFPAVPPEYLLWQQALYQRALAEAQAVVRPSLPERDLLAVWN